MTYIPGGLDLQRVRLENLTSNLHTELTPEARAALFHVAVEGYNACLVGHHPRLADQFDRFAVRYEAGMGADTSAIPEPRAETV